MLISLKDLRHRGNLLDFKEEYPAETFELTTDVRQSGPLKSDGRAMLIEEHDGHRKIDDIRVVGQLATDLEILCARCLEPVHYPVQRPFDLLYRPAGVDAGGDKEVEIQDEDAAISYYRGEGVELEDLLREQILLEVPLKTLCREDCKGLCPHCGHNRNTSECECAKDVTDPRWDALKGLKDKLQK